MRPYGSLILMICPAFLVVLLCTFALVMIYLSKSGFTYDLDFEDINCSPELDDYEDQLIKVLKTKNSKMRSEVIMALEKLGNPRAVEALASVLDDTDPEVALEAAEALGTIGDPKALLPLLKCSNGAQDLRVRNAAKTAIVKIQDNGRGNFLRK
jgi:HEAT repeat protein